jgi:exodeoxyribonuclease VII large subunit
VSETSTGLNREVLSVSELNRGVRRLLEGEYPMSWVEGEISNFVRPSSGHWYFTLKDQSAQLRCAMFKNRNMLLRLTPRNGMHVIIRGRISLYEGRGEFQMVAEHIEDGGDGALRRAFDQLKLKLQREGLFDEGRKQPIPDMPLHVGIVTSPTGAAILDILHVLKRRFPAIEVSILPVQVQGADSIRQIVRSIDFANRYADQPFDVLLLTRGGGSLEDLMSFNSEPVARAVADSEIPVVCAVGHESDVSIADFVADLRAPTPSAAAELISPDSRDWLDTVGHHQRRLATLFTNSLRTHQQHLQHLSQRLKHPGRRLQDLHQRLDGLELRLRNNLNNRISQFAVGDIEARLHYLMKQRLQKAQTDLQLRTRSLVNPLAALQRAQQKTVFLNGQLQRNMQRRVEEDTNKLHALAQQLNALSPLATLERGYAIVSDKADKVVTRSNDVATGDTVKIRLQQGQLTAEVTENNG